MEKSGGMMVHKATHRFDFINLILNNEPERKRKRSKALFQNRRAYARWALHVMLFEKHLRVLRIYLRQWIFEKMYFHAESDDGYQRDHRAFKADTDIYGSVELTPIFDDLW